MAETGDSYWSDLRANFLSGTALTTYKIPMTLMPTGLAPFEKQVRVAVSGVEYIFDDGNDPTLITNKWNLTDFASTPLGTYASQVRLTFSPESGLITAISELDIWDGNDVVMTDITAAMMTSTQFQAGNPLANCVDNDATTHTVWEVTVPVILTITFPDFRSVSKVGWSRTLGAIPSSVASMQVEINVGTPTNPTFVVAGTATQVYADYPVPTNPFDPETMHLTQTVAADLEPSTLEPRITITPALAADIDRITLWRETRQDRPWVQPTGRAYGFDAYWFLKQQLFIFQEMAEYWDLGGLLDAPPYSLPAFDFSAGSQIQNHLNLPTATVYSYADLELLQGITGSPQNDISQLIVEQGDQADGTSTVWIALTFDATPVGALQYSVQSAANTITLGSTSAQDHRIRRTTKIDDMWVDIQLGPPSWNRRIVTTLSKQIRLLSEEAPQQPVFWEGSLLFNSIFARAWNWLVYTGTDPFTFIGGPYWTGTGEIRVYKNNILLTDPTDYQLEWPGIRLTVPLNGTTDRLSIGTSGNNWFNPFGNTDDGLGEEDGQNVAGEPTEPREPVDPLDPLVSQIQSASMSVSFVAGNDMLSGPLEGRPSGIASISSGNASTLQGSMYMRIQISVAKAFGAHTSIGENAVVYVRATTVCGTPDCQSAGRVLSAHDSNGDGTYDAVTESDAAFGCALPSGVGMAVTQSIHDDFIAFRGGYSDNEVVPIQDRLVFSILNPGCQNNNASGNSYLEQLFQAIADEQTDGNDGTLSVADVTNVLSP